MFVLNLGCNQKQKTDETQSNNKSSLSAVPDTLKKGTIQEDNTIIYVSGTEDFGKPNSLAELEGWRSDIINNGSSDSYMQLSDFHANFNDDSDEMIKFSEIMIQKRGIRYALDYYYYIEKSNLSDKSKLMNKAIQYLTDLTKMNDDFFAPQARRYLSKIYMEGKYTKKDTVIVNYLKNNGTNLDSITRRGGFAITNVRKIFKR